MKKTILISLILPFTLLNATNIEKVQSPIRHSNMYVQYDMGLQYKHLKQTLPNLHKAFNLLHKSALKGHSLSQYELALMFHYGQGVQQNAELARLWFTRAAKKGHPQAQDILYRFYSAKKPSYYLKSPLRYSANFRTFR